MKDLEIKKDHPMFKTPTGYPELDNLIETYKESIKKGSKFEYPQN